MPLSNSTDHTTRNLCGIVEKWLEEHQYRLHVNHGQHEPTMCCISTYDRAGNPLDLGVIGDTEVILLGDDPYTAIEIKAHDKHFFDLLAERLIFAKP